MDDELLVEEELLEEELPPEVPGPPPHAVKSKSRVTIGKRLAALFFIMVFTGCFCVVETRSLLAMLKNRLFKGELPNTEFRTKTGNFGGARKFEVFL